MGCREGGGGEVFDGCVCVCVHTLHTQQAVCVCVAYTHALM